VHLPAGLLILIGYLLLVATGNLFELIHGVYTSSSSEIMPSLFGIVLYAIPAYGLYRQQKWAWISEIIISSIAVLLGLFTLLCVNPLLGILTLVTHTLIITYLMKKSSKALYLKPKEQA
jgi:hypothetical protein